ncbi:MAG: amidohydrolase family protein [Bacteroidia bacterium]
MATKFIIVEPNNLNVRRLLLQIVVLIICAFNLNGQNAVVYTNANIHNGLGKVIEKGYLVIANGKIIDVGEKLNVLHKNAKVIDLEGKHIYPGLIALNNYAGLNEIDAVRATRDYSETGLINPNVRSLIAFNTDSKILPTFTFNGILYTQAVPIGGLISGSSSLMKTQAWNWEDAVVKADDGIHINWPDMTLRSNKKEDERNKQLKSQLEMIEQFFADCEAYYKINSPVDINLKIEAMRPVFDGKANLYVHAINAKSIITAINFFKIKYPNLKLVLVEAGDAWQVIDLIKKYNIPVVLTNIHRLPKNNHSDIDEPFKAAAKLVEAGVLTAIGHSGSWEARNIMFNAGTCAAYGLSKEQALQLITYNAAKILGVEHKLGSIQIGLDASFTITKGDILDMKESIVLEAYLEGETIDLKNHQFQLYKKYSDKYKITEQ